MKEEVKLLCWSDDETEHTRQTSIPAAAVRSTDNSEGWNAVDAMVHTCLAGENKWPFWGTRFWGLWAFSTKKSDEDQQPPQQTNGYFRSTSLHVYKIAASYA